jgi:hypothetical protein
MVAKGLVILRSIIGPNPERHAYDANAGTAARAVRECADGQGGEVSGPRSCGDWLKPICS